MSLWRHLTHGLRALANRSAAEQDVRDEVQDYLDRAAAAYAAHGLSPEESRRAARLELGSPTAAVEEMRSFGWENVVESVATDLRYAVRRLRASPGFAVVSILTLALGIGAASAIFSTVNPILFASLPYPGADRLVTVIDHTNDGSPRAPTFGTFEELRARARSFAFLAASDRWEPSLTGVAQPERLRGQRVTANYFRTLGVAPAVGRGFTDADDGPGGPLVAVLSARIAARVFGGDSAVLGRKLTVDENAYVVIGVMPRDFANVIDPAVDIWAPLQARAHAPFESREWGRHYEILGRLAPNVSSAAAARETKAIGSAPAAEYPRPPWADMRDGLVVRSLQEDIASDAKPTLLAIAGAALLLLAIACVNVTNLLMARGARRRGEFAMRVALGAGRGRLVRQLLAESLVLAMAAGALGIVIAEAGVKALVALSPPGLPRVDAIRLDGAVFAFAFGLTTFVGLVVGIMPAFSAARAALGAGLQAGSRRSTGRSGAARGTLVIAEVALALMLLAGAGLLTHSLQRLFAVAPGFDTGGVITMEVAETGRRTQNDTARVQFFADALDAVRNVPGVSAAAFTSQLPFGGMLDGYGYEVRSAPSLKPEESSSALRYAVSTDYFKAMRIPLLRGRTFDAGDFPGAPEAIVVSETFARRAFGGENPIGQRVRFGPEVNDNTRPWDLVVGVVGDVKQGSLADADTPAFYVAMGQWKWVDNVQSLVVRTSGDAAALAPSLKRAIWTVDANVPVQRVSTMSTLVAGTASQRRFALIVIEAFAVAALALAAIGMYGVISGGVEERTREIGIRTALGATPRSIVASVVGRGFVLTGFGVALGLCGAIAGSRLLVSLLFEVSRLDPATYVAVVLLLTGVAAVACWIPASRAARVDPVITLRSE